MPEIRPVIRPANGGPYGARNLIPATPEPTQEQDATHSWSRVLLVASSATATAFLGTVRSTPPAVRAQSENDVSGR
jgi:hypothetical protein